MLRRPAALLALATLLASFLATLAPAASAQAPHLTVEARDGMMGGGGMACGMGHMMCLVVTQGSLDDLKPGASASITFTNAGHTAHELHLVDAAIADASHAATNESKAFASSDDDMAPGASQTFDVTVPATVHGVYMFCAVGGHESSGMWLQTGSSAKKGSPAPGVAVLAGLLLLALASRRRVL